MCAGIGTFKDEAKQLGSRLRIDAVSVGTKYSEVLKHSLP
jgi:hypothetical protein